MSGKSPRNERDLRVASSSGSPVILGLGIAAVLAVLGTAAAFWLGGGDETSPEATTVIVPEAADGAAGGADDLADDAAVDVDDAGDSGDAGAAPDVDTPGTSEDPAPDAVASPATADPFGVEDVPAVDAAPSAADGTGPVDPVGPVDPSGPADPSGEAAAPARVPGTVVEVPQSYPVTEADKYFVPREERRPGNLGGPPPLDFPGGPSDPDRAGDGSVDGGGGSDDPFGPPSAPGQ